jgi:hypothetical protein
MVMAIDRATRRQINTPTVSDCVGMGMKQRTIFVIELIGGLTACVGVALFSVPVSLIDWWRALIVVACEANS